MHEDRHVVGGELDVELDEGGALVMGALDAGKRVFGCEASRAAMADDRGQVEIRCQSRCSIKTAGITRSPPMGISIVRTSKNPRRR